MRNLTLLSAFLVLSAPAAMASDYYLSTDVPANLGGTTYEENDVVRKDSGDSYSLKNSHPSKANVSSLHRRDDGKWQFSPAHPTDLGGTTYEARDIVDYDGSTYSSLLDGGDAGIPKGSRIDAVFYDTSDNIVVSFDTPTTIDSTTYEKSDLVVYDEGTKSFSSYWDASDAGVPVQSNVVGADEIGGNIVVTFDVPTTIDSTTYKNGDLAEWNDGTKTFSTFFSDASWPPSAQTHGVCGLPSSPSFPGGVPDSLPATALKVDLAAVEGDIDLTWGASCSTGADDYSIYEGTIGDFTGHDQKDCTTGGALLETLTPAAGDTYYIVVPSNTVNDEEGSYGTDSSGTERVRGASPCKTDRNQAVCP
jgi:hypothetical protein